MLSTVKSNRWASRIASLALVVGLAVGLAIPFSAAGQDEDGLEGSFTVTISEDDIPQDVANGSTLIGTWRVAFNDDGTYQVDRSDIGSVVTGSYEIDGDEVTITDESGILSCTNPAAASGDQSDIEVGTYSWEFTEDKLAFTALEDSCRSRVILLSTAEFGEFVACLVGASGLDEAGDATPEASPEARLALLQQNAQADDEENGNEDEDEPADDEPSPEVEAAIDELLSQLTACWATGDPSRFLPLTTDTLQEELAADESQDVFLRSLTAAMGTPLAYERAGRIRMVDDETATAIVRIGAGNEEQFARLRFVLVDDEWRWDGFE